jgi:hypothetical protein
MHIFLLNPLNDAIAYIHEGILVFRVLYVVTVLER